MHEILLRVEMVFSPSEVNTNEAVIITAYCISPHGQHSKIQGTGIDTEAAWDSFKTQVQTRGLDYEKFALLTNEPPHLAHTDDYNNVNSTWLGSQHKAS